MRWLLRIVAALLALGVGFVAIGLTWAHFAIRQERPALPAAAELRALANDADRPVRVSWIETASQGPAEPGSGTRIAHPVFVLEWADGRLFLVDAGMQSEAARAFGRPMEILLGAAPVDVGRSVDVALGAARGRVAGGVFTHLHIDHTQGIAALCSAGAAAFAVFMSPAQLLRPNYGTRPGLAQVREAPCARPVAVADSGLSRLPGFPGVGIVRVAGHTPGSQVAVAWVGDGEPQGWVFAGDVVFEMRNLRDDRPKPLAYRLFVTPEAEEQLGATRRWLRALETEHGMTVVPSHDHAHIEGLALPRF